MIVAKYRSREVISNYIILIIFALIAILPLAVLIFNSIKPQMEFGVNPLGPPSEIRFENFSEAWVKGEYAKVFFNSLKLVAGSVFLCLAVSLAAGFSLAKLNPKGSAIIAVYLLVGISIPAQLYIEANLRNANFTNAKLDGANTFQLFFRVALPLSWPVILTAGLIISLAVWNEFLFALTFISEEGFKPMATILFAFQWRFENNYALQSASAIMMVAPVAILFMLFQRRFISGLTSGGLKG